MRDMFKLGYCIRMDTADTAELRLYGEIIADMPEAWKWSKEDKSAADFDKAIKEAVRSQKKTIKEVYATLGLTKADFYAQVNGKKAVCLKLYQFIDSLKVKLTFEGMF